MEITTSAYRVQVDIVAITGRLEAFTVKDFRTEQDKLLSEGSKHFIIDLTETTFMDSAGMSALVSLLKRARQSEGDVVLVKPAEPTAFRILTLTRFDRVFKIADTVDSALKLF